MPGISARRIKQSLALLGLTPDDLSAILISHEHTDHTAGLATLLKHHPTRCTPPAARPSTSVPVCPSWTAACVSYSLAAAFPWALHR